MPFLHRFPLIVNIERKGFRHPTATHQFRFTSNDESKAGNSLYTFISTTYHKVDTQLLQIDGNASKTTHCIYNQALAIHLDYVSNVF